MRNKERAPAGIADQGSEHRPPIPSAVGLFYRRELRNFLELQD
jgi:hypothetical protein